MRRDLGNLLTGFVLCLSLILFVAAHRINNGPADNNGSLTVIGPVIADSVRSPNTVRASYPGNFQADGAFGSFSKIDGYLGLTMSMPGNALIRNIAGGIVIAGDAVSLGRAGLPPIVDAYIDANGKFRTTGAESVGTNLTVNNKLVVHDSLRVDNGIRTSCFVSDGKVLAADSIRTNRSIAVGGQPVTKMLTGSFTLDVGLITLQSSRFETVTVTGLNVAANWTVHVQPLSADLPAGVGIGSCRVSADNTLKIEFTNDTIANVDPASQTFSYIAFRQ